MKKSFKLLKIIKATEQLIPIENGDFQKDYINWYNTDRFCKKLKGLSPINFRKQALNSVSMT